MTKHSEDIRGEAVFSIEMDASIDRKAEALKQVSRKLIRDSEKLRERSTALRDEIMRTQSD